VLQVKNSSLKYLKIEFKVQSEKFKVAVKIKVHQFTSPIYFSNQLLQSKIVNRQSSIMLDHGKNACGLCQRLFFLGKAEPKGVVVIAAVVEGRQGNGRDAKVFCKAHGKLQLWLLGDILITHQLEIGAK
jgi:hypothetical protein